MELPPYLATMPMHAITEMHGEAGLRERFRLEIKVFDEDHQQRLDEALTLASRLHRDDRRSREPYVNHLLRVAIRMMHYYEVRDVDVIVAGLLHDAVEDHPAELAGCEEANGADESTVSDRTGAALEVLAERFGPRVARLVAAVTNPPWDPGRGRDEQYHEHVAASLEREPWARVVKISDFTDNGVGVIHSVGPKVESLARKYRPLVPVYRDLVTRADTPLSDAVRRHILDQLDLAEERFSAILDQPAHPA
ncbi:bifunctional (p)ppGpp synthetase/guanosine-3',5'-bis(diphosphate) 3'-pyrophosphohydrolase [Verrucosispora sp. SN26_14.1]|uniref:HD domain-containing protein n=1 Tax=Verrucosispora sp. SN26_14.1 TaxID=2527879 RepID=UPI001033DCA8|nr:HD domain-containing protein [Verrucosispora sp. SN26_14.1]TBL33096.1 bifunctional (p)ppGpp synthetase/guanosine-3',5'-bis(diphosphate) 3'-pyrophosphohydrolase [Verrucosispora sp. SN26_14.1]